MLCKSWSLKVVIGHFLQNLFLIEHGLLWLPRPNTTRISCNRRLNTLVRCLELNSGRYVPVILPLDAHTGTHRYMGTQRYLICFLCEVSQEWYSYKFSSWVYSLKKSLELDQLLLYQCFSTGLTLFFAGWLILAGHIILLQLSINFLSFWEKIS